MYKRNTIIRVFIYLWIAKFWKCNYKQWITHKQTQFYTLTEQSMHITMHWNTSRSMVVLEQVQNGCLYIRYRNNSMKNKAAESKSLQTISTSSIAKPTLYVPLTFNKVEKTKHEYFDFVHLVSLSFFPSMSSPSCITQKLYDMCKYYAHQATALLVEIIPICLSCVWATAS